MNATNPAVADAIALRNSTLTKLKTFCDGALGGVGAELTKLTTDEVTFGTDWLKAHLTGYPLQIVDGALVFGGTYLSQGENTFDALALGKIADVQNTIDHYLTAAGAN